MSCRLQGEKSIRVKANDLKRSVKCWSFRKHGVFRRFRFNISKEKCIHGPAKRQFNVVTREVTFEKFECNYQCTKNSMNSVFMARNANGPWTELSDSMYQMPMGALIQTFPNILYLYMAVSFIKSWTVPYFYPVFVPYCIN